MTAPAAAAPSPASALPHLWHTSPPVAARSTDRTACVVLICLPPLTLQATGVDRGRARTSAEACGSR